MPVKGKKRKGKKKKKIKANDIRKTNVNCKHLIVIPHRPKGRKVEDLTSISIPNPIYA